MRRFLAPVLVIPALLVAGCGDDDGPPVADGTFVLEEDEAEAYPTAYVHSVVADPPGDDLAEDGGEHVVIANNADIRVDMGGWWLEVDGERLPLGIGRQVDVGTTLRVHPGPGETDDDAVFVGLDEEVLDDDRGFVVLRDAAGSEVARMRYRTER